jgi:hypothetical protein
VKAIAEDIAKLVANSCRKQLLGEGRGPLSVLNGYTAKSALVHPIAGSPEKPRQVLGSGVSYEHGH